MAEIHRPDTEDPLAGAFRRLRDDVSQRSRPPGPRAAVRAARQRSAGKAAAGVLALAAVAGTAGPLLADNLGDRPSVIAPAATGPSATPSAQPSQPSPTAQPPARRGPVTPADLLPAEAWPVPAGWQQWQETEIGITSVESVEPKGSCLPKGPVEGLTGQELMRTVGGPGQDGQIGQVAVQRFTSPAAASDALAAAQDAARRCPGDPQPYAVSAGVLPDADDSFVAVRLADWLADAPPEAEGMGYAQVGESVVWVRIAHTGGPAPSAQLMTEVLRLAVERALAPAG